jgi:NADH:ubiquinone oxidoreductase subunit F (NADH-binding)
MTSLSWPPAQEEQVSPELLGGVAWFSAAGRTLLEGPAPDSLGAHHARYGPRPAARGPAATYLLDDVAAAGLTGRGGAGFPVAAKWRTALAAGPGTLVVANGAESELLSAKDTALLVLRPHLVLDGLSCAAEALRADGAIIWLHEGAPAAYTALVAALEERAAAGVDSVPMQVSWGPDSYLTGESSAVVNALEGGSALPRFTRQPAARSGVQGRPTVIHNVETLARVALIARVGGASRPPGPLVTVPGAGTLAVRELPGSTTVAQAVLPITLSASGNQPPQAVLVGGYGGSWAAWDDVAGLALHDLDGRHPPAGHGHLTRRRIRNATHGRPRPALGPGILAAIPQESCPVAETAAIADYLARSSARQCGPCLFGTRALADGLIRIAAGSARRGDAERLRRTSAEVNGRGACGLPDGLVSLVRTALDVFADDVDRHLRRKGCLHRAGHTVLHVPAVAG